MSLDEYMRFVKSDRWDWTRLTAIDEPDFAVYIDLAEIRESGRGTRTLWTLINYKGSKTHAGALYRSALEHREYRLNPSYYRLLKVNLFEKGMGKGDLVFFDRKVQEEWLRVEPTSWSRVVGLNAWNG